MNVKVTKKRVDKVEFSIEGITPAFANALRRTMISEVPTLAVEFVDFHENTSVLFDEIIAQRMGLIPLKFTIDKFNFTDSCKCDGEGCPSCQVVFAIEKTGPSTVYSGDMKSSNSDVKPAAATFPIVELLEGQRLKLEATARLGVGKDHAKFQAAIAAYKYVPEDTSVTNPKQIAFMVESASGLEASEIVEKAAEILGSSASEFRKELNKL